MNNESFEDRLNDLSRVNIFVGANNTGKSRFMRSIFFNNGITLKFLPNDKLLKEYSEKSKEFKSYETSIINPYSNEKQKAYDDIKSALKEITYIEESITPLPELVSVYKTRVNKGIPDYERLTIAYINLFEKFFPNLEFNDHLFKYDFYKIYLPSLRGLVPITLNDDNPNHEIKKDFYAERIKKDYFSNHSDILTDISDFLTANMQNIDSDTPIPLEEFVENYIFPKNSIITGQRFYQYVRNYLLGDLEQRERIREYELYLSETFFDNKKVVLIPKVNDDVLTVRIDNEEYKIYELGEGIQSIILITLPLFLYLEKSKEINTNVLVFIEEPEVGLHPRLQRKLLETLLSQRFENYQFFFTTHSNHFMDKAFEKKDISIYSFDKTLKIENNSIAEFTIENVGFNHLPTLKKLGALPSSVLSHNCTILVEGSYDISHYNFYLDLYQDKLLESGDISEKFRYGTHYSFLRGGGKETAKTISEFNSIQKQRIFTILDKDDNKDYKKNKIAFEDMGYKNYCILEVREVENLISKKVLIKILKSLRELRKLNIKEDFEEEDYQKSNFYTFITDIIIPDEKPNNFFNPDTFKKKFAYKEQEFTESFDDLSEPAKVLTKKIYTFIKENNSLNL